MFSSTFINFHPNTAEISIHQEQSVLLTSIIIIIVITVIIIILIFPHHNCDSFW